jgi:hypothetical protein
LVWMALRRYSGLAAGLIALGAMWVFASEPLVWEWMGRPPEVYPELIYALFGLPAGIIACAAGGWVAFRTRSEQRAGLVLKSATVVNVIAVLFCILLVFTAVWPLIG